VASVAVAVLDDAVTRVWRSCVRLASLRGDNRVVRLGSSVLAGDADRGFPAGVPMVYCLQSWRASGDGVGNVVWGLSSLVLNKGGCPKIPTCAKMKSCRMRVTIDLVEVSCSGRLRRFMPGD
jgi:hypothetical protein